MILIFGVPPPPITMLPPQITDDLAVSCDFKY
jgi:hypothetical protein